ncbi:MAG TPA: addiction module protein [Planctomycetaceae bacterium]
MSLRQFVDEALRLPEADRAALAAALLESLDPEAADEIAWDEEIRSRLDELDRGDVTPIPWEEARKRIAGNGDGPTG